jgi:hypothetical protein
MTGLAEATLEFYATGSDVLFILAFSISISPQDMQIRHLIGV